MPKIVDHGQRRTEIVEAYLRVLADRGASGTNGRTLAHELGVVPGTIWHYFDSVEQIAEAAARRGVERTLARIAARSAGQRGLRALLTITEEILPLDVVTQAEARVVVAFWGQMTTAARDRGALGRVREFTELTRAAVEQAREDGEIRPDTPVALLVRQLDSLYAGEQVILAADSTSSAPGEIRAVLALTLAPWTVERSLSA
ncbi:TetR family transcriptional regulator [Curtobacterium flaccumfaciens]|uniref:TetR/AcrR family transcriptional regulator n=1 Tax=Curtobacterium flaccumfaciens TaxID=2035 RepID=UPI00188B500F|nr:TetR/AcrR family transcriptional regulator [Curtobacterium flaccumfaciens]MBF4595597.1 TetR family transcriptional regulator [Curtobacterium flaccumfaciens]